LWGTGLENPAAIRYSSVYGENGGPGGLFHLCDYPPILEICSDIQKLCPEAYLFNLSNPMTRICLAISRKFPELKVVGFVP
jgi:alpha-galactosidase